MDNVIHIRIPQELGRQMDSFIKRNNDWIPNRSQLVRKSIEHFLESCDHLRKIIDKEGLPNQDNKKVYTAKKVKAAAPVDNKEIEPTAIPSTISSDSFDVLGDFD